MDDHLRPMTGGSFVVTDGVLVQVEGHIAGYPDDEPAPESPPPTLPTEGGSFVVADDGTLTQIEGPALSGPAPETPAEPVAEEPAQ